MTPVTIPSNETWGRKSGSRHPVKGNIFQQVQRGVGRTGDGKGMPMRFHWPLPAKLMPTLQRRTPK